MCLAGLDTGTKPTPDAIPNYRPAQSPAHNESIAIMRKVIGGNTHQESLLTPYSAPGTQSLKIRSTFQAQMTLQCPVSSLPVDDGCRVQADPKSGIPVDLFHVIAAYRKLVASTCPTVLQNLPSTACPHSLTKTMYTGAPSNFRLPCSLWHGDTYLSAQLLRLLFFFYSLTSKDRCNAATIRDCLHVFGRFLKTRQPG